MREHSKENIRLGKIVFYACIALAMLAVTFCKGQVSENSTLSREKQGHNWITRSCVWELGEGDTVFISTYNRPNPYDFHGIIVQTTGKDKTVQDVVLSIYFENGTSIFVGAIPGKYEHGASWFELTDNEKLKLKTQKVKKMEIFNRYTSSVKVLDNWTWQYFMIAAKS